MRAKSNKLRRLENGRYSVLTNDLDRCIFCGAPDPDIHEVFGGSNRQVSMANGFCVPLCRWHHLMVTNPDKTALGWYIDHDLKEKCQKHYEKDHTREEFIKLVGKNYLGE